LILVEIVTAATALPLFVILQPPSCSKKLTGIPLKAKTCTLIMATIYHITTRHQWQDALRKGYYEAPSLVTEGFIHCSDEGQVKGVLEHYFKGQHDLLRLVIDTDKLQHLLQYDTAPSLNEAFPRVYGPINLDAVLRVEDIPV
jgi:uncharacterized protein (DUF952 family)